MLDVPRARRGRAPRGVAGRRYRDPRRPAPARAGAQAAALRAIAMPSVGGLPGRRRPRTTCRRWPAGAARCGPIGRRYGRRTASRPPLNVMEPEALAGYVRWGFRDRPDGQVELSCPPEVEAWFFECGTRPDGAPAVVRAPRVAALPTSPSCAADGTDLPGGMFAGAGRARRRRPRHRGRHALLRAGGHRARAADLVREHLAW